MRSLGTTTGAAVVGLVLAQMTTDFSGVMVPSETGFRVALILGAGISVIAAVLAALIPSAREKPVLEPVGNHQEVPAN